MSNRNRGIGTIYYRKDRGVYEGRIKTGVKNNGRAKYKYTTKERKTDVINELIRIKAKVNEGEYLEQSKTHVIDWMLDWLDTYMQRSIKKQTYTTYKMIINKTLRPILKNMRLKDLNPKFIQQMFNQLGDRYSPATLRKIKSIFNLSMVTAIENDLISRNPLIGIKLPKIDKPDIESMSVPEIEELIAASKGYNIEFAIRVAVCTGLRIGELLALTWDDFDAKQPILRINKTLIRIENKIRVQESLKTESSQRTVPISRDIAWDLIRLKRHRLTERIEDNGIMFCSTRGTYTSPRNFNRSLEAICKKAGIGRISANVLRHSFASIAIERDAEVKAISEMMGHTKIETTYNNYVHPKNKIREVADIMSFNRPKTDF
jgi:integrase